MSNNKRIAVQRFPLYKNNMDQVVIRSIERRVRDIVGSSKNRIGKKCSKKDWEKIKKLDRQMQNIYTEEWAEE